VDTAYTRALSVADTLDMLDFVGADAVVPIKERSRLRMELVAAAAECRQAAEKLLDLHGLSGFAQDNRLQRFWRDIAVGTRHPQLNRYSREAPGACSVSRTSVSTSVVVAWSASCCSSATS
jgi:alkylation response protein AidB-like acyl-CoA dehydrogenase